MKPKYKLKDLLNNTPAQEPKIIRIGQILPRGKVESDQTFCLFNSECNDCGCHSDDCQHYCDHDCMCEKHDFCHCQGDCGCDMECRTDYHH